MTQSVWRRLAPEERRNHLLDCARQIVLDQGLSMLTMERLASEAGVSNPLIYKYFDTRLQLLQELLIREYKAFQQSFTESEPRVGSYRDVLRGYVDINFRQFAGGDVLGILLGQADVSQVLKDRERARQAPFLINELAHEFNIAKSLAEKILVLSSGASLAAAEHYSRVGGDREAQIDQTVAFIFGGIQQILKARPSE